MKSGVKCGERLEFKRSAVREYELKANTERRWTSLTFAHHRYLSEEDAERPKWREAESVGWTYTEGSLQFSGFSTEAVENEIFSYTVIPVTAGRDDSADEVSSLSLTARKVTYYLQ